MKLIGITKLSNTYQQIKANINLTPIITNQLLNKRLGLRCYFKCENMQVTGSFKARGAYVATINNLYTIYKNNLSLATHSSGNHGIALSHVGKSLNLKTLIVVPENAPYTKINKMKQNNAHIIFCAPQDRQDTLHNLLQEHNAIYIPSANHEDIILGQSTCAFETFNIQHQKIDTIITPVGGGGLLSGTCLSARAFAPKCRVIGAEPILANDCSISFKKREKVVQPYSNSIADGLRVPLAEIPWQIIRQHADDILTCHEETIVEAMKLIRKYFNMTVEPSSATTLAVILENLSKFANQDVMGIISGGNISAHELNILTESFSKQVS